MLSGSPFGLVPRGHVARRFLHKIYDAELKSIGMERPDGGGVIARSTFWFADEHP